MSRYLVARGHVPMESEQLPANAESVPLTEGWLRIAEVEVEPFRVPTDMYQPFQTVPLEITSRPRYDFNPELRHRSRNGNQIPVRFSGRIALNQMVYGVQGYFYESGSLHGVLDVSPIEDHPVFFERLISREQQILNEQKAARIASRARRDEMANHTNMGNRFRRLFSKNRN